MRLSSLVLLSVISFMAFGCGDNEVEALDASPGEIGTGPDAMFNAMTMAVQEKNPELVWNYLPKSYRRDVNGLVHEFASTFDPEVWSKAFLRASCSKPMDWKLKPCNAFER